MTLFTLSSITALIASYGYLIIFLLVMIEGPIVSVITGSLIALGILNFIIAYIVIVTADLAGDSLHYAVGRYGGEKFINKWGHLIGLKPKDIIYLEKHYSDKGLSTLLIGKISHGIGGVVLISAGLAKMPFPKFIFYNFVATIVKSLVFLLLGFYFGQAITKINSVFEFIGYTFICLLIATIIIYYSFYYKKISGKPND